MILMTVVGQVGCITPAILLGALFAGLWLDRQFETRPLFTILFVVGSAPVSVIVLYRIVRSATNRLKSISRYSAKPSEEEAHRE
jgi:F0F1-type ATP synthase assembly protein I